MSDVYVLIASAVYDHGVYGVFATKQEAVAHAEALLDESDYHHTFRVDRRTIGAGLPPDKRLGDAMNRGTGIYEKARPIVEVENDE